ncbi:unnamed protein product [Phytophthora fragariaefolia]|uniref:Unnamed protein product n=1 Tax=Phytophthora fragariaefolia TaxID=1490495 RepID=A0A9W6XTH2_9STRA|nr:unnamed protein product [Phytophthora fragariaefolia]
MAIRRHTASRPDVLVATAEMGVDSTEVGTAVELRAGCTALGGDSRANEESKHPFETYFGRNWDKCRSI